MVLLGVCSAVAVGLSIYFGDLFILAGWLALLLCFFVVCGVAAIFNVVIFAPIFWLIGRLTDKKVPGRTQTHDKHTV